MKGVELPINVLVIVAIAVLVMLGLVALYMAGASGWGPLAEWIAVNNACSELKTATAGGCATGDTGNVKINWDTDGDTKFTDADTLRAYCDNKGGEAAYQDDNDREAWCKVTACGCTGITLP